MPLEAEAPNLDDRTFDDIFQALRLRIPQYTPEWTDFNESDPGITLVQLFAWLTEQILYRLNQVPDRSYIKFLQLIGLELRPAHPAVAHIEFTPRPGAAIQPITGGSRLSAQPASGGDPLIFETDADLAITHAQLTDVQVWNGTAFTVVTDQNETDARPFWPLGSSPQPGNALYLGFTPPAQPTGERLFPLQLRWRVYLPTATQAGRPQRCAPSMAPPQPPVTLAWEYFPRQDALRWRRLNLFADESAAFTREGYITVGGPDDIAATKVGNFKEPRLWLRCRFDRGNYPADFVPEIDLIRPNTVPVRNLSTIADEVVGTSDGRPDQTYTLRRTPVPSGTLVLETEVSGEAAETWTRVDDFLCSTADDLHYVLNENTGEIRFGDGRQGRIPFTSADIVARSYRFGGGTAGNVGPGTITTPITALLGVESVTNQRPAVGGRDEEQLDDLKARAPREIRRRSRAVTEEDFASLASEVGGVRRAAAIPLRHPAHCDVEVPGTVTVVIVPDSDDPAPQPSSDLIRAVCTYLEDYRLLTTEVFVEGPRYQRIFVDARVAAQPYAAPDTVERDVINRLSDALDPNTREFGIDFYPTSLYAVILGVSDVLSVERLAVQVDGVPRDATKPVIVPPGGLVFGADHDITVTPARDR
jgi:predicted phage baseplate assembly protein